MKKILCYGDSNTYGFIPKSCGRYEKNERWTGILSELLPDYEVIEEGLNNRMGFFKSPEGLKYCGGEYLSVYLQNHRDLDMCIIALGTNDAQFFYNLDEKAVLDGLKVLTDSVREVNKNTKIIIIPPVKITENLLNGIFVMQFDMKSIERIENVFPQFKDFAEKNNCLYFDFNEFVTPSELDGIHYTQESHKIIAFALADFIKSL